MTSLINSTLDVLNNREKAILIWVLLLMIIGVASSKIRKPILDLLKAFFAKKLVQIYFAMIVYIIIMVFLLNVINLWGISQLGDTLKWSVLVGFVMLSNYEKAEKSNYFKTAIISNLKILVIVEFIVNLYVFSLPIEFILTPFLALLGAMTAIADSDKQYAQVKKIINFILSLIGSIFLIYSLYMVITDFNNFVSVKTFEGFCLPIVLSILFLPFVYLVALYSNYETFFIRLGFFVEDPIVLKYAKTKTVQKMNINLNELRKWSKYINSNWRFKEKQEVDDAILNFCKRERNTNT